MKKQRKIKKLTKEIIRLKELVKHHAVEDAKEIGLLITTNNFLRGENIRLFKKNKELTNELIIDSITKMVKDSSMNAKEFVKVVKKVHQIK